MSKAASGSNAELPERIGEVSTFERPEGWTLTESWQRAQTERDRGNPINDAERMVWLEGSDTPKRVLWAIEGASLKAECPCASGVYRDWCAHLASLWWQWVRGRLHVTHLTTGRQYRFPPLWIFDERPDHDREAIRGLTPKQMGAYLACELGDKGVREYARETARSPGTVGNHLRWARESVEVER